MRVGREMLADDHDRTEWVGLWSAHLCFMLGSAGLKWRIYLPCIVLTPGITRLSQERIV